MAGPLNPTPLMEMSFLREFPVLPMVLRWARRGWRSAGLAVWTAGVLISGLAVCHAIAPPGVVIDFLPAAQGQYVGSPALARLADGTFIAAHDFFGPRSTEKTRALTAVFRSTDRGRHWEKVATVEGAFWSSLFTHQGALYLLGSDAQYGHAVIRRSLDGGRTWSEPREAASGLLFTDRGYHGAPVPVTRYRGRLWRAMEDNGAGGGWGRHFRAFMLSVPLQSTNLLDATQWTASNRLPGDPRWLGGRFRGWLEGNAVVSPSGNLLNVLRVDTPDWPEQAALIEYSRDGRTGRFDPDQGFIPFPGGAKKFTIRFDAVSGLYWSLVNYVPPSHRQGRPGAVRNTLALAASPDLFHWEVRCVLLHHPDAKHHGFQYVDWLFNGEDLVAVCRTAWDEPGGVAHNYHDANYLTFHRVSQFRRLEPQDSVDGLASEVLGDSQARCNVPRVLLLGDSISIGYHAMVRRLLGREMIVVRPMRDAGIPENCEGTTKGLARLEHWLAQGGGHWGLIHFNWGLHDLKRVDPRTRSNSNRPEDPRQAEPAVYERQLRALVARLKQTGAKLIFATTTPVPEEPVRPWRDPDDVRRYNAIARRIMEAEGVAIDDLYALALPNLREWQLPANVHFKAEGYARLGKAVAAAIRRGLAAR